MNHLIAQERSKCSFHLASLSTILHGGQQAAKKYQKIVDIATRDTGLQGGDLRHMTRQEQFEELLRRHVMVLQRFKQLGINDREDQLTFRRAIMGTGATALSTPFLTFVSLLQRQASDEQLASWMPLVQSFRMIGCCAQTEIGHGTSSKALGTTATFDPSTDLITLNSPTPSSAKFWIAGLGRTSTHCVVLAQLYSKGFYCGVQAFLLPLRNHKHLPLPGITLRDIGPSVGMAGVDSGCMRLNNVTIPRSNMLMRHARLHSDGTFSTTSNNHSLQDSMALARVAVSKEIAYMLTMAVTIATRYSTVRVQSSLAPNKAEVQIIEHKTQQHKLLPLIALAYAFNFSVPVVEQCVEGAVGCVVGDAMGSGSIGSGVKGAMEDGSTRNAVRDNVESLRHSELQEAYSVSSCFKVLLAHKVSVAVQQCRLACGGHGFLNASNLPVLYKDLLAMTTAEGEVSVLLLQAGRYLLRKYAKTMTHPPSHPFPSHPPSHPLPSHPPPSYPSTSSTELSSYLWLQGVSREEVVVNDLQSLVTALQFRARGLLEQSYKKFEAALKNSDEATALNLCAVQLNHASMAHIESVVASIFCKEVEKLNPTSSSSFPPSVPKSSSSSSSSSRSTPLSTYRVLRDVCNLHLMHTLLNASGDLLQLTYITPSTVDQLERQLERLYDVIRPDAVSLVDAFELHDRHLSSALGCYDGNVYDRLFRWAQASSLNQHQVHPAIDKYLKPMRQELFSKL